LRGRTRTDKTVTMGIGFSSETTVPQPIKQQARSLLARSESTRDETLTRRSLTAYSVRA
jgi:hypothetical protein